MLFKANPYLWSLHGLTLYEMMQMTDSLAHNAVVVRPIFECVKVYVKLDESGHVRYARHLKDFLGSDKTTIINRMKDPVVSEAVKEALDYVEETLPDFWPFRPGSASWCLLEILDSRINVAGVENPTKIIIREAVRIDIKGNKSHSSLLDRMFERMKQDIIQAQSDVYVIDPIVHLRNVSGSGVYTALKSTVEGIAALEGNLNLAIDELSNTTYRHLVEAVKEFADGLFLANSGTILNETAIHEDSQFYLDTFPGINVELGDRTFRLTGSFLKAKEELARSKKRDRVSTFPPILGWRS